jgi:hypothetical protein
VLRCRELRGGQPPGKGLKIFDLPQGHQGLGQHQNGSETLPPDRRTRGLKGKSSEIVVLCRICLLKVAQHEHQQNAGAFGPGLKINDAERVPSCLLSARIFSSLPFLVLRLFFPSILAYSPPGLLSSSHFLFVPLLLHSQAQRHVCLFVRCCCCCCCQCCCFVFHWEKRLWLKPTFVVVVVVVVVLLVGCCCCLCVLFVVDCLFVRCVCCLFLVVICHFLETYMGHSEGSLALMKRPQDKYHSLLFSCLLPLYILPASPHVLLLLVSTLRFPSLSYVCIDLQMCIHVRCL